MDQAFLYRYAANSGKAINAKPATPTTNPMPAPGQCITLNKIARIERLPKNVPRINAAFFMFLVYVFERIMHGFQLVTKKATQIVESLCVAVV